MRFLPFLFTLLLFSCNLSSDNSLKETATGNWLLLYADHSLMSAEQRQDYRPVQDSLIDLYGLKLLQLAPDGKFTEMDSFYREPGRWDVFKNKRILIADAGTGFELFFADFISYKSQRLKLLQKIAGPNDSLSVIWAFKKIDEDDDASVLFEPEKNEWRKKSTMPETDMAIKKRLVSMLDYYAAYFDLVASEAIYFSPKRLGLPFSYYAHSVGMKPIENAARFSSYFYSAPDAQKAYGFLKTARMELKEKYPVKDNYVKEYAAYFKQISKQLAP